MKTKIKYDPTRNYVRVGTCYYESISYVAREYGHDGAKKALDEGRVKIGKPPLKKTDRLMIDKDGRYHVLDLTT